MSRVHYAFPGGVTACTWLMPWARNGRRSVHPGEVNCWACRKFLQRQVTTKEKR